MSIALLLLLMFGIGLTSFGLNNLQACDTPVFQYALERWEPTIYQLVILTDGPLTEEQQKLVDELQKRSVSESFESNMYVRVEDISEDLKAAAADSAAVEADSPEENAAENTEAAESSESASPDDATDTGESTSEVENEPVAPPRKSPFVQLYETIDSPTLPCMALVYPFMPPEEAVFWHGELTSENVEQLIDSPLRTEMAEKIIDGNACIWVFLPCGNKEADEKAEKTIRDSIKEFREAYLADFKEVYGEEEEAPPAPEYHFIKLDKDNEREDLLRRMLMRTEPDLADYVDQPMVFPVFGRGRSLYALIGKGINDETIYESCGFLIGPCSCTIKDANPGLDLMIAYPWDQKLAEKYAAEAEAEDASGNTDEDIPPLVSISSIADMAVEQNSTSGNSTADENADPNGDAGHEDSASENSGETASDENTGTGENPTAHDDSEENGSAEAMNEGHDHGDSDAAEHTAGHGASPSGVENKMNVIILISVGVLAGLLALITFAVYLFRK